MVTSRRPAIIVGVLFLVATGFFAVAQIIHGPVFGSPDYLALAGPQSTRLVAAVLVEIVAVLAIPLTAIFLFPVLKSHSEAVALAYVGIRLLEAVPLLLVDGNLLALVATSESFVNEPADAALWEAVGSSLQGINASLFPVSVALIFPVGAILLNSMLYRTRLVPRVVSGWGFLAAAFLLVGSLVSLLGGFDALPHATNAVVETVLVVPIAVQEMVFAVWLIARGFNADRSAETATAQ